MRTKSITGHGSQSNVGLRVISRRSAPAICIKKDWEFPGRATQKAPPKERGFSLPVSRPSKEIMATCPNRLLFSLQPTEHVGALPRNTATDLTMAEPSMVVPLAIAGAGGIAIAAGVDSNAVVAAFGGAAMFAFMSKGVDIWVRVGMAVMAWIFGYYCGMEVVSREIWGFKSPSLPSYVAAFSGVVVLKLALVIFDEQGKKWILKKLGLSNEGPKE